MVYNKRRDRLKKIFYSVFLPTPTPMSSHTVHMPILSRNYASYSNNNNSNKNNNIVDGCLRQLWQPDVVRRFRANELV